MADKKIYVDHKFQQGAKINLATTGTAPTVEAGDIYFDGTNYKVSEGGSSYDSILTSGTAHSHTLSEITDAGTAAAAATGDFAAHDHNHDATYLGITAQAADADTLDGQHGSEFAADDHGHVASEITDGTFADARISASSVTQHQASIDHDALTNFNADEHRVIDDSSTDGADKLWSASKIVTELSTKSDTDHTHSAATTSANGFMSSGDKTKLDAYPSTNSEHGDEFLRKDGTFTSTPAGSGSGTVNSGTANEVAYYAQNGAAVSGTGALTLENATNEEFNIGNGTNKGELGISCNSNLTSSTYPLYVGGSVKAAGYYGTTESPTTHHVTPDAGDGYACLYGDGYVALKSMSSEPSMGEHYAGIYAIDDTSSTYANLWAVGTDGSETQISPHDENGNWIFHSIDRKRGKRTKINMVKVIRALEEMTGEQFIFEENL